MPASSRSAESGPGPGGPGPKPGLRVLEGARIRLRPLESRDLPSTRAWRNRDDVRLWFRTTAPVSPEQHAAWWRGYSSRDDDLVFVIEEKLDGGAVRPVGTISVYAIDRESGRAEFGRLMIGEPAAAGRGLAREATNLLADYALSGLGLRQLDLEVRADNVRAIALYERSGFTRGETNDSWLTMRRTA